MQNQNEPKIAVPIFHGKVLEISDDIIYFEKKKINPIRTAFRIIRIKIELPNGDTEIKTAYLNDKFYIKNSNYYEESNLVGIAFHLSGIFKGFYIVQSIDYKLRHDKILKTLSSKYNIDYKKKELKTNKENTIFSKKMNTKKPISNIIIIILMIVFIAFPLWFIEGFISSGFDGMKGLENISSGITGILLLLVLILIILMISSVFKKDNF